VPTEVDIQRPETSC